jgi:aromatic-L-amino-acid decarboxylase
VIVAWSRRGARALRLWPSLMVYGVRRLAAAIERGIALADYAQRLVEADDRWEVVTPAQLGIITSARRGTDRDDLHSPAAGIGEDGYAALIGTRLHGRSVLRLCAINPRTTSGDIVSTLERLGVRVSAAPVPGTDTT